LTAEKTTIPFMINPLIRSVLRLIQLGSNLATLASSHLVVFMGRSAQPIHPKNLIAHSMVRWYLPCIRPGDRVLDVGAGVAAHAVGCARAGAWVVAAELSKRNLARARPVVANTAVSLIRCDVTLPLPFRSEAFTGVLLLDILEHLDDPVGTLRESARVLRSGGWVAISLPNARTTWKERYRRAGLFWMSDRDHKHEYTWPEIADVLQAAGLRLQSGPDPIVVDTPLTGLIDLLGGVSLKLYSRLTEWRVRAAMRRPEETTGFRCTAVKA
jgi:SAM-dependent methyltransferase